MSENTYKKSMGIFKDIAEDDLLLKKTKTR